MKVRISTTVEIDPQKWDAAYGTGTYAPDVRKDVLAHATALLWSAYTYNSEYGMYGEQ